MSSILKDMATVAGAASTSLQNNDRMMLKLCVPCIFKIHSSFNNEQIHNI